MDVLSVLAPHNVQQLTYTINRSNVPNLFHNELTLLVDVGSATNVLVTAGGSSIPSTYNSTTEKVQFTTSASSFVVTVENNAFDNSIGGVEKAALKHNRDWAWSHGFDDNTLLKPAINDFMSKGWPATLFMITSQISPTRQEDWIVDQPDLINYLNSGWAVGNHGYLNNCDDATEAYQLQAIGILEDIVALSNVPDYKILSFAIPCFNTSTYGPVADSLIAGSAVDMEFYESGNSYLRLADPAHTFDNGDTLSTYTANGITAVGVELNGELGRDFRFEGSTTADKEAVKDLFDWMAAQSNSSRHFWYNTLAHGDNEVAIAELLTYLYSNYGPGGTNEVWVAPSTEIYSYILVRDNATISLESSAEFTSTPTQSPTATQTATHTPTATHTHTPTSTATQTPTATETPIEPSTPTQTSTPSPTGTETQTPPSTATQTMTPTVTSTVDPEASATATATSTSTAIPGSETPVVPTATATVTETPVPQETTPPSRLLFSTYLPILRSPPN